MGTRFRSLLALLLIVPIPSIGILSVLVFWPGPVGQMVFSIAKICLMLLPVAWLLLVERKPLSFSPVREGGLGLGLLVGLAMAVAILGVYTLFAGAIDPKAIRSAVGEMGIGAPGRYLVASAYWIFVNSVIEEYVFRWFIGVQCERLLGKKLVAALLSALFFMIHHTLALSTFLSPGLVALASLGVFIAGLIWSLIYARTRSVWPGWVAHALADIAVFAAGWHILFGV